MLWVPTGATAGPTRAPPITCTCPASVAAATPVRTCPDSAVTAESFQFAGAVGSNVETQLAREVLAPWSPPIA